MSHLPHPPVQSGWGSSLGPMGPADARIAAGGRAFRSFCGLAEASRGADLGKALGLAFGPRQGSQDCQDKNAI